MKEINKPILALVLITGLWACNYMPSNSLTTGATKLIIENSDSVAIEQQLFLFMADYPKSNFITHYMPQEKAVAAFLADSARVLICDRDLLESEKAVFKSRNIRVKSHLIAAKTLGLIYNNSLDMSAIDEDKLVEIMEGRHPVFKQVAVADANGGVSKYLRTKYPKAQLKQALNEEDLLSKVAGNSQVLGVLPIDYMIDPTTDRKSNLQKVKVLAIRNAKNGKIYSAAPANAAGFRYPLVQEVYLHNADGGRGLGEGLANFVLGDRGQLVFKKLGWFAVRMQPRDIELVN